MKKTFTLLLPILLFCCVGKLKAQTELTFYTSMGNFKVMLTDTLTPITVDSFKARVRLKFYDGLLFHRVIANFVIQGGDPLGNGTGGPGYQTPDEFNPTLKNTAGSLAMANSGANTNGSQFYVNLVNNASLNNRYTVFGMVTTGFPIVQAIGRVPTTNDKPVTNVYMDSVRITNVPLGTSPLLMAKLPAPYIYPNPCRDHLNISLPAVETKVELIDAQGRLVYSNTGKNLLMISVTNLPAGIYAVRMSNTAGTTMQNLLVE